MVFSGIAKRLLVGMAGMMALTAQASFELAMVLDANAPGGGIRPGRVHRFDPNTGRYLGSFGGFSTGATSLAVDQSRSVAYVYDSGFVSRWNYNTGDYLGVFPAFVNGTHIALNPSGTQLVLTTGSTNAGLFNPLTGSYLGEVMGNGYGTRHRGVAFIPGANRWLTSGDQWRNLHQWSSSFADLGSSQDNTSGMLSAPFPQITHVGGRNSTAVYGSAEGVIRYVDLDLGFGFVSEAPNVFGFTRTTGLAPAHFGYFAVGNTTNGWAIGQFNEFHQGIRTFGEGIMGSPRAMATVLAPEPGTMLAVGAGLAALAVRRRRRV